MKGTLINTPTLETGRLILRKFTERDLEWLFLILHDKEVNQFLPWYPIDSIEEAKKFYEERYASKYVQPQAYAYAICLKTDDHPIGYIKVDMEEHHDFGYGLRREFWHQGLVTEAGKAVIAQVKKDGLPYITATHDRNNPRSGGVMRNVGMKYQYSYEEQWQPKNFLVTFRMYQLNLDGNTDRVYKKILGPICCPFYRTERVNRWILEKSWAQRQPDLLKPKCLMHGPASQEAGPFSYRRAQCALTLRREGFSPPDLYRLPLDSDCFYSPAGRLMRSSSAGTPKSFAGQQGWRCWGPPCRSPIC